MCCAYGIKLKMQYSKEDFQFKGVHLDERLKTQALPHQKQTVEFMIHREDTGNEIRGGLVLSDLGLGKTLSIIYACVIQGGCTLIVCPAHLVQHWRTEILKHTCVTPDKIWVYHGPGRQSKTTEQPDFVITTYGVIGSEGMMDQATKSVVFAPSSILSRHFDRLVFDEGHYIKNRTTKAFMGSRSLRGSATWLVSGTPIMNRSDEMYTALHLLGVSTAQQWATFNRLYCNKAYRGLQALQGVIRPLAIRHEKSLLQLPHQICYSHAVQLNARDSEFYRVLLEYSHTRIMQLAARYRRQLLNGDGAERMKTMSSILVIILRLRQACCDSSLVCSHASQEMTIEVLSFFNANKRRTEQCSVCLESDASVISKACGHKLCGECWMKWLQMRTSCPMCNAVVTPVQLVATADVMDVEDVSTQTATAPSSKTLAIMQIIERELQAGRSIVVCSQWRSYLNIIINSFEQTFPGQKYITLTGADPPERRHQIVKQFQEDDTIPLCFATLGSSAEGITLTKASVMVMSDLYWNASKMKQMSDRIYRIGQTKETTVYTLVVNNTIENKIEQMIENKRRVCEIIAEGKALRGGNVDWLRNVIRLLE